MTQRIQISAGTGPVEVRTFVALLAAQVHAHCGQQGLTIVRQDRRGPADTPASVTLWVAGDGLAFVGWSGTHVLVSPTRGARSRKRWFASVGIGPERNAQALEINPADVDFQCTRSGGPGGQHVNTTASAVRAKHRPSGLSVRVSSERCQHANRRVALRRLGQMLVQNAAARRAEDQRTSRRSHYQLERGNPVMCWKIARNGALERR